MEDKSQTILKREELEDLAQKEKSAISSLIHFRNYFFPSDMDVPAAPFHHEWSNILLYGDKNYAFEGFRESAKTQIVIRANAFHALTFPMFLRSYIIFICANQTMAGNRLIDLTKEWKVNKMMRSNVEKIMEDNSTAFEVRYKDGKRVRLEAYGKGAYIRGISWGSKRPDLVILDDIQSAEDVRSETTVEADWKWFISDIFFLGKSSRIFLIGNNLGEKCVIERVLRDQEKLNFVGRKIPILGEDGEPTWPAKYSKQQIIEERDNFAAMGEADTWFREKMCQVIAPDSQKFKKEHFLYYDLPDLHMEDMNVYVTVDLAVSMSKTADYTVICTVGVTEDGHWMIIDMDRDRYDPSQTIDAIFRAVSQYRPLSVGLEVVAYQKSLKHFLYQEMPKRNKFFTVSELQAKANKYLRIDALQPRFVSKSVWLPREGHWVPSFESELMSYPHGKHDDMIDALAYVEQIASVPMGSGGHGRGFDASALGEKLREKRASFSIFDKIMKRRKVI